jgi:transposase
MLELESIEVYDVYHLPIIKAYADWIDLVNTTNQLVPIKMDIDPGTLVLAMVLDALSARDPLYRIESFFKTKDTELLLAQSIAHEKLTHDNFGRLLDHLYEAKITQLYSAIVINALRGFEVPTKHIHYDRTSMTVFGQYHSDDPESPKTIKITKGTARIKGRISTSSWYRSFARAERFRSSPNLKTVTLQIRSSTTPC